MNIYFFIYLLILFYLSTHNFFALSAPVIQSNLEEGRTGQEREAEESDPGPLVMHIAFPVHVGFVLVVAVDLTMRVE
jgi:hypothetical protein